MIIRSHAFQTVPKCIRNLHAEFETMQILPNYRIREKNILKDDHT